METLPHIDSLWNHSRPEETETAFRAILGRARDEASPAYYTELLTQLARTQSLQGKFSIAHEILDEADGLISAELSRSRVRYFLERGRAYNSAGEKELARKLFHEAWDLARTEGEEALAVDAAHMIAITESGEDAIRWNLKAMEYAEHASDLLAQSWLGSLYNNLGWALFEVKEYDRALECFEKDLAWFQERKRDAQARIARWSRARLLRALGRTAEAYDEQLKLRAEFESAGAEQDGYNFEELGECALELGKSSDLIREYFREACRLLESDTWFVANEPVRFARIRELAGISE